MSEKKGKIKGINSLFDELDRHLDNCEEDMSKWDFNTARHHAIEAVTKFGNRLSRDLPKLSRSHQKVAESRLKEKIEKEYVLSEAEKYLKRVEADLNDERTRRMKTEQKRETEKLGVVVKSLRDLFDSLKGL